MYRALAFASDNPELENIISTQSRIQLTLMLAPDDRRLLSLAAKAQSKTLVTFILDAARYAATNVLLDRTFIQSDAYAEFVARLDAPPSTDTRLKKTMRTKAPWE